MQLQKATRKRVKIKMSIASPTGFGKTYSALLLAFGITNDWSKIAVIDTENASASLYSHLGDFNVIELKPPFSVEKGVQAIGICEAAGIEVIILDSAYHFWHGPGGLLEYNQSLGGRYQDWAKTTPLYMKWLNSILQSTCHVITTLRKKQGYSMSTVEGKTKVEKMGMEDEMRAGYDYEMTIALELINDKHLCRASKDRTELFTDKPEFVITPATGKMIKDWCETGEKVLPALEDSRFLKALAKLNDGDHTIPDTLRTNFALSKDQIKALEAALQAQPA